MQPDSTPAQTSSSVLARGAALCAAIWRHPANRRGRLRALGRFFGWQFAKRAFKRPITIAFHNGRLRCYPDSTSTSGALYFNGYPDYWEMKFLQAYLRSGDHFLDIGANSGVYSVLACAYVGPTGSVDAFEPHERTALRIEEQAALNGLDNLRVHRMAVSDQDGSMAFGFSRSDATLHLRRPGEMAAEASGEARDEVAQVRSITLDNFAGYQQYAAAKMDIEGAEPMALAGAAERLKQANPPVWLLELAGYSTCYGISSEDVVRQLAAAGFDCAIYHPESATLHYTDEPWRQGVQNVLAIARAHREAVAQRLKSGATNHP